MGMNTTDQYDNPSSTNTTVMGEGSFPMSIIVTGFFVTSLAYLVCFCCCIIQFFMRRGRDAGGNIPSSVITGNSRKNDTLKKRFLKNFRSSLKRLQKKRESVIEVFATNSNGSCPICFEDYNGDPAEIFIGLIKSCGHYFHFDCIWPWLEVKGTCPLCRESATLKESDVTGIALRHLISKKIENEDTTLENICSHETKNNSSSSEENENALSGTVNLGFDSTPNDVILDMQCPVDNNDSAENLPIQNIDTIPHDVNLDMQYPTDNNNVSENQPIQNYDVTCTDASNYPTGENSSSNDVDIGD